jgi:hypothetical protein
MVSEYILNDFSPANSLSSDSKVMNCGDGYSGLRCGQCSQGYYRVGVACKILLIE